MSTTVTLPYGFHYVGGALLSTVFVLAGQFAMVVRWRIRSGVKYPQLYAEKAEAEKSPDAYTFNCAQRAHQNTLENMPVMVISTLLTATKHPIFAAIVCGVWSISRVGYTIGYATGRPANVRIPRPIST